MMRVFTVGLALLFSLSHLIPAEAVTGPQIPIKSTLPKNLKTQSAPERNVTGSHEDVSQRTAHTQRWVVNYESPDGKKSQGSYTRIQGGLHYNAGTETSPEWKESDTNIVAAENGATVNTLASPIQFKAQLEHGTPVMKQTLSGKDRFLTTPSLIVYHDRSTDQSVVLARIQPSQLSFEDNVATYPDAFDHLRADVRYTVSTD